MCGAFIVIHTSTIICNSVAIKNLVRIVKYLKFLTKVHCNITGNVNVYVKIMFYLYYVLNK